MSLAAAQELTASLAVKLGSLVVHAQEMDLADGDGFAFDLAAATTLASDPEVVAWLRQFGPGLLPEKRSDKGWPFT